MKLCLVHGRREVESPRRHLQKHLKSLAECRDHIGASVVVEVPQHDVNAPPGLANIGMGKIEVRPHAP